MQKRRGVGAWAGVTHVEVRFNVTFGFRDSRAGFFTTPFSAAPMAAPLVAAKVMLRGLPADMPEATLAAVLARLGPPQYPRPPILVYLEPGVPARCVFPQHAGDAHHEGLLLGHGQTPALTCFRA
jgi:hypothetical protein